MSMNPFGGLDDDDDAELPEILGADDDSEYTDDEDYLFLLEQLEWKPTPTQGNMVAIAVGRDTIIVGTDRRVVILLKVDFDPQLFVVGKKDDLIHNLFVDNEAQHLIVTMKNGQNFYVNLTSTHSSSRRKQTQNALSKVKGVTIESMVWSRNAYRDSTGLCLCGTSNGCIYSLQISDGKEKVFTKLYDLNTGCYGSQTSNSVQINHSESTCFRVCGLHVEYLDSAKDLDDDRKPDREEHGNIVDRIEVLESLGFADHTSTRKQKGRDHVKESKKFYIVAVIPSKIFEFIGGPTYDDVFKSYHEKQDMFMEVPGSLKHTSLCVYKPHNQMAEAIGWLTEPGIVLCKPTFGSHVSASSGVIGDSIHESIIPYGGDGTASTSSNPLHDDWHGMSERVPQSFAVTQFHLVLVYSDCYLVINRLSKECVHFENVPCSDNDHVVGIASMDKFIYVMSGLNIFQISAQDESRDVWRLLLEHKDFLNANKYARNNWQRCKILRCEAEYYFDTDRFEEAARKYVELSDIAAENEQKRNEQGGGMNNGGHHDDHHHQHHHRSALRDADLFLDVSFEEIALKFLNVGATDALMTFLREKLNRMHAEDTTQRTILATWLTEMHLSKMNEFASKAMEEEEQTAVHKFEAFLKSYRTTLRNCKQVVFDLIASHGRSKELVEFARIQEDYKWVLNHYAQNHQYKMAIRVLETLQTPSKHEELYYEFAPILMYVNPEKTVDMLIKVQSLDPKKLIPALMRYDKQQFVTKMAMADGHGLDAVSRLGMIFGDTDDDDLTNDDDDYEEEQKSSSRYGGGANRNNNNGTKKRATVSQQHRNQAIRFLQYCIEKGHEKSKDPAIHNYLISLYCKQRRETQLLEFIKQHREKPLFDVKYALRLCHQEEKVRSCVELYKIMDLYEEAIRLALTIGRNHYKLAKDIAAEFCEHHPSRDEHNERKRLWLIIARHVVDRAEIDGIAQVLDVINESSVLSIEDILPHLADFTEIGPFKKDIKASLEKYSRQIAKLQKEMDNYTDNANQIRKDTKQLLLRSSMITSNRKCDLSGKPILNTQFVLFPCTHIFRFDELTFRIFEYKKQIGDTSSFESNAALIEYAQRQCPLCGDMMIDQVTRPFIDYDDDEDRKEALSWQVGVADSTNDLMSSSSSAATGGRGGNRHQQNQNPFGDSASATNNPFLSSNSSKNKPKGKQVLNLEDIDISSLGI